MYRHELTVENNRMPGGAHAGLCLASSIYLYYKIALSRVACGVTPQPRHWLIMANSVRSRHRGHATAE